jgi:uncharacterized protein (TIGR02117 family)
MHRINSFQYLQLIWKIPIRLLELFWAIFTLYFCLALIGMFIQIGDDYIAQKKGVVMYLRTDGIHTDFILPVQNDLQNWSEIASWNNLKGNDTSYRFVAFGWGDQGFFLNTPEWSDLKFMTAFDALFYRGKTAIHVVYQSEPTPAKLCKKLVVSKNQYIQLCKYIKQSFLYDNSGKTICIQNRGYWDYDAFYQAKGKYSLFSTCNSWINGGLKTAELPACMWTPLSYAIFDKYD